MTGVLKAKMLDDTWVPVRGAGIPAEVITVPASGFVAAANWQVNDAIGWRIGNIVTFSVVLTRLNSVVTITTSGDVGNQALATAPAELRGNITAYLSAASGSIGRMVGAVYHPSDGLISLVSLGGTNNLAIGEQITVGGTFMVDTNDTLLTFAYDGITQVDADVRYVNVDEVNYAEDVLTLTSGWTAVAGFGPNRVTRSSGLVTLEFMIRNSTGAAATNPTIATIPVGFRPAATIRGGGSVGGPGFMIQIASNGGIQPITTVNNGIDCAALLSYRV